MRVLLGCVILVAVAVPGLAQQAFQVKDINPGVGNSSGSMMVSTTASLVYLTADTDSAGRELWKTDGTGEGTVLVKDITPGEEGTEFDDFTVMNDILYFTADTDVGGGAQLWRSDGTEAGTYIVKDIDPGGSEEVGQLAVFQGKIFFSADDGVHNREPWTSDGTEEGTELFLDMVPAGVGYEGFYGGLFTQLGEELLFVAYDGLHGQELWKTDGTPESTILLKDINDSEEFLASDIEELTPVGDQLIFSANDGTHFKELWASDGTAAGTRLVRDINISTAMPWARSSEPHEITAFKGMAYFIAAENEYGVEVWKSDGTEAGTSLLKDVNPGPVSFLTGNSLPEDLTAAGDRLYFIAFTDEEGRKLWSSDGTEEGTIMVAGNVLGPHQLFDGVHGWLYFSGNSSGFGTEVWRSNGADSETKRLTDINTSGSTFMGRPMFFNGYLYFGANDGNDGELWALNIWPWVESISPVSGSPTAAESVEFTVTFSESVSDVDASDFELLTENIVGASITAVSSSDGGITWTVTVDTGAGAGTIRLALNDDDSIVDTFEGLPLEGYGVLDGSFTGALGYTTDPNSAEAVLAAEAVGEGEGETAIDESPIPVTLTFNRGVTGIEAADFTLSNATIQNFTGEGGSYTFELEALGGGMVSVQLPSDAGADYGGVPTGASNLLSFQFAGHDGFHSADSSRDNVISLSETLRVIQFFNAGDVPGNVAGQFYCAQGTEDGYTPDPAVDDKQDCVPHDTDYNPQDWKINLSELLRVIQIFNQDVYSYCPGAATEDGYCPGVPPGVAGSPA